MEADIGAEDGGLTVIEGAAFLVLSFGRGLLHAIQ